MAEGDTGYKWWIRYVVIPVLTGGGSVLDQLTDLSTTPFFFQRAPVVVSRSELRTQYARFASGFEGRTLEVRSTDIRTVQEAEMSRLVHMSLMGYLHFSPRDKVVLLTLRAPGSTIDDSAWLVVRKTDDTVKVAAFQFN